MDAGSLTVSLELSADQIDVLARRVAEIVMARTPRPAQASTYLSVSEAAELLRGSRQRVYDLLSSGRLTRHKDGSRVLIRRDEIERHLTGEPVGILGRHRTPSRR